MIADPTKSKSVDDIRSEALEYVEKEWKLKIQSPIASGGFGSVYLATDAQQRKHAVKISVKPIAAEEIHMVYLRREVDMFQRIRCINVVEVFHSTSFADHTIIDMEKCDKSLKDYVEAFKGPKGTRFRPLSETEFRGLAKQLTTGICAIHGLGIAHRDIKPANILLNMNPDGSYVAKYGDLGLAKEETLLNSIRVGTPEFTAPEIVSATGETYSNRCDYWSLGVMYYYLLTGGRYPFESLTKEKGPFRMEKMYRILSQEFTALSLPSDIDISPCCSNFVFHHLFKNPDDRIYDDDVKNHPFVMPAVCVMRMDKPVNSDDFLKPIVCDVELGEIHFQKAKERLGDGINKPHPFLNYEAEPILWGDVVHAMDITDAKSDDGTFMYTNDGVCCKEDAPVEMKGHDIIRAFIVSSMNGVQVGEMRPFESVSLPESAVQVMKSEQQATLDRINQCFVAFADLLKSCRTNIGVFNVVITNCRFLEDFRSSTLKTDNMAKRLRDLQEEVRKKFDGFPIIGLCLPVSDSALILPDVIAANGVITTIRSELGAIKLAAENRINYRSDNFTEEVKHLRQLWEQYYRFVDETKRQLANVTQTVRVVMNSFQKDAEVMTRLTRYVDVLQKALTSADVTAIYRELLPLVKCDYFRISDDDMKLLMNSEGLKEEPAPKQSVVTSRGELDDYLVLLTEQLSLLEVSCDSLKEQSESLLKQSSLLDVSMASAIAGIDSQIESIRAKLRKNGIPDPTED